MRKPNERSIKASTAEPSKPCAVIIGAGTPQGIGGAVCAHFAAAGMHVYAAGRSIDKVQETTSSIIENGGKASAVVVDATEPTSIHELFEKAGLRTHAQAMAREFQPKGIHVAHVVIDGLVAGDRASEFGYGLGKAYLLSRGEEGSLDPAAVAETYWQLHVQPRTAWTHELELRPFKEKF
ncbi:hypothetical protein OLMES_0490 [Oleiphilus messinensis]|uniref:Short chain dehydrogenase n=1 Tax=Oleiphilus messinensis TaxID=141451 RepID=A0A1Y0I5B2_9GAMM|nr:SDR family NAD(P)-dependent oxidoreductase [Oleiphilus messinensis]ARU54593.1 hypothetical protein OLMES_0490 [Oleiphilus messinensis]